MQVPNLSWEFKTKTKCLNPLLKKWDPTLQRNYKISTTILTTKSVDHDKKQQLKNKFKEKHTSHSPELLSFCFCLSASVNDRSRAYPSSCQDISNPESFFAYSWPADPQKGGNHHKFQSCATWKWYPVSAGLYQLLVHLVVFFSSFQSARNWRGARDHNAMKSTGNGNKGCCLPYRRLTCVTEGSSDPYIHSKKSSLRCSKYKWLHLQRGLL